MNHQMIMWKRGDKCLEESQTEVIIHHYTQRPEILPFMSKYATQIVHALKYILS